MTGKTDISRRLMRYLSFFHALEVATFDVAEYRRQSHPDSQLAEYNDNNLEYREGFYDTALEDMRIFLNQHEDGVAILDAVCPTHEWRLKVKTEVQKMGVKLVFIEVRNNDVEFLNTQISLIASRSPDYKRMATLEEAENEIRRRIASYETIYESISEDNPVESKWSYFTCDHSKRHFVVHNVTGHITLRVINFIMNLRITSHSFYLTRHWTI